MPASDRKFASRGGEKLDAALEAFGLDVRGRLCADFGCNVGGFTDCLLQRGAEKVYAVDTGYGELAWALRKDSRVVVMERTNALYAAPPQRVDLVVADMAWTVQEFVIPAAMRWLGGGTGGAFPAVVSLLKPHYELARLSGRKPHARITESAAGDVCVEICRRLEQLNVRVRAVMRSPLLGKGSNMEFLLWIVVDPAAKGASFPPVKHWGAVDELPGGE